MKLFNQHHLRDVEETYLEHFKFGIWASFIFFLLFLTGTIHAIFPMLLPRLPDQIFNYFCNRSQGRIQRVNKILNKKNID